MRGLDAAIEAAHVVINSAEYDYGSHPATVAAVHAAAPHIRRAALNEAAEAIRARYSEIRRTEAEDGVEPGRSAVLVLELAALIVEGLRERAERETT